MFNEKCTKNNRTQIKRRNHYKQGYYRGAKNQLIKKDQRTKKKKDVNRQPFDVYFPTHSRPKCIISFQSFKKLISTIQAKPHLESK